MYFLSPPWIFAAKVVIGIRATSSESWPIADWPLRASSPTTSKGTLLTRTTLPTGSEPGPNRLSDTVPPSTITLVLPLRSCSVKPAPDWKVQARIVK